MKKKTVKKRIKKVVQPLYKVSFKIFGKNYEATGTSLTEAVCALKVGNVKGRSILTVTKGDQTKERILMPVVAYRLFSSSGLMKQIALKNINILFGL